VPASEWNGVPFGKWLPSTMKKRVSPKPAASISPSPMRRLHCTAHAGLLHH
jgi:hypothetical protein